MTKKDQRVVEVLSRLECQAKAKWGQKLDDDMHKTLLRIAKSMVWLSDNMPPIDVPPGFYWAD